MDLVTNVIYVAGGYSGSLVGLSDVYRFTISTGQWSAIATSGGFTPRMGHFTFANIYTRTIYLAGGYSSGNSANSGYYTDTWAFSMTSRTYFFKLYFYQSNPLMSSRDRNLVTSQYQRKLCCIFRLHSLWPRLHGIRLRPYHQRGVLLLRPERWNEQPLQRCLLFSIT